MMIISSIKAVIISIYKIIDHYYNDMVVPVTACSSRMTIDRYLLLY